MLNDKLQAAIAKFKKQAKWPEDNDKFSFRVAVKDDYPQINVLFETTFGEQRTPEHVQWKYWGCPSGEPFAIIAEDASTKKLVAACTGMIKKAWVNGQESSGIMLWDIAVHPDVRGGGRLYRDITYGMQVAVNAQRQVNWGFGGQSKPNVIKMGIRWFGYHMILSLKPYELRLTLAPALKQRFGPLLGSAVAKIADCFVASPQPSNKFSFKNISECGPEFDQLFEQQPKLYKVSIWRDAATLNWRYFDNPIYKHTMLAAYANDKLQGYVVWREYTDGSATVATVLDLWHGEDQQLAQDLFLAAAQQAKSRGVSFIRISLEHGSTSQQAVATISGCKISERVEDDNIITSMMLGHDPNSHSSTAYEEMDTVTEGQNWFYSQGDVDFRD